MTSAFDEAKRVWEANHEGDFNQLFLERCRDSIVFVTPSEFLVAEVAELPDGKIVWHVLHAIGSLPILIRRLPWKMEWIAFQRLRGSQRLKVYKMDRILALSDKVRK